MPLLSEVGEFESPGVTGNQVIPLNQRLWEGETPKLVIIWGSGSIADLVSAEWVMVFGAATASAQAACCTYSANDETYSLAGRSSYNNRCILLPNSRSTTAEEAEFVSFGTRQFTVNWTKASATTYKYNYLCLGGSDLTNVSLDEITAPAGPMLQSYTVGFQPTSLIAFGTAQPIVNGNNVSAISALGMVDSTLNSFSIGSVSMQGETTSVTHRWQTSTHFISVPYKMISSFYTPGSKYISASVSSLDASGFTLLWDHMAVTQRKFWVISLRGPNNVVITDDSPISGAKVVDSTTVGFAGKAALLSSFMGAANVLPQEDGRLCVGAIGSPGFVGSTSTQSTASAVDEHDQTVTDADRSHALNSIFEMLDHQQNVTTESAGSFSGATLEMAWSVYDFTEQRQWGGLVLGGIRNASDARQWLPTFTQEATAEVAISSDIDQSLPQFEQELPIRREGSVDQSLPLFGQQAAGVTAIVGVSEQSLSEFGQELAASVPIYGTIEQSLPQFFQNAYYIDMRTSEFLSDLMNRRVHYQTGHWTARTFELIGAGVIEPTAFEPDPTTYRGEYYYNAVTNALYRKIVTRQEAGVVVAHWQKVSQ